MNEELQNVAVIGAGAMGAGIAQVAALSGCQVMLYDVSEAQLAAARLWSAHSDRLYPYPVVVPQAVPQAASAAFPKASRGRSAAE